MARKPTKPAVSASKAKAPVAKSKPRTTRQSTVKVQQLAHAVGLPLPAYQSDAAAGLDLVAAVPEGRPIVLRKGATALIPTGLVLELPRGTEGQVRPRSGLALKHGVTVLNAPGTIDADYRGEIGVILVNHGPKAFKVARGERIAQLVVAPVTRAKLVAVARTTATQRGAGGFGSTGSNVLPRRAPASRRARPSVHRTARISRG